MVEGRENQKDDKPKSKFFQHLFLVIATAGMLAAMIVLLTLLPMAG